MRLGQVMMVVLLLWEDVQYFYVLVFSIHQIGKRTPDHSICNAALYHVTLHREGGGGHILLLFQLILVQPKCSHMLSTYFLASR